MLPLPASAAYPSYLSRGYVTAESADIATSLTLEYAMDDGVLASVAAFLGHTADAGVYHQRSTAFRCVHVGVHACCTPVCVVCACVLCACVCSSVGLWACGPVSTCTYGMVPAF